MSDTIDKLEWGGTTYGPPTGMGQGNGRAFRSCLVCGGVKPDQRGAAANFNHRAIGHAADCKLDAAIKRAVDKATKQLEENILAGTFTRLAGGDAGFSLMDDWDTDDG